MLKGNGRGEKKWPLGLAIYQIYGVKDHSSVSMEKALEWMWDGGKIGNREIPVRKSLLPKFQEKDHKGLDWNSGIEGEEEEIDKENLLKIKQSSLINTSFSPFQLFLFQDLISPKSTGLRKTQGLSKLSSDIMLPELSIKKSFPWAKAFHSRNKINIQKSVVFIYTSNEHSKNEIK